MQKNKNLTNKNKQQTNYEKSFFNHHVIFLRIGRTWNKFLITINLKIPFI